MISCSLIRCELTCTKRTQAARWGGCGSTLVGYRSNLFTYLNLTKWKYLKRTMVGMWTMIGSCLHSNSCTPRYFDWICMLSYFEGFCDLECVFTSFVTAKERNPNELKNELWIVLHCCRSMHERWLSWKIRKQRMDASFSTTANTWVEKRLELTGLVISLTSFNCK